MPDKLAPAEMEALFASVGRRVFRLEARSFYDVPGEREGFRQFLADQPRRRPKRVRKDARLTGAELASRAGWGYSKVSKIETAKQEPSEDDVTAWATICELSPETRDVPTPRTQQ